MKEDEWKQLLRFISQKRCTPFIGPEAYEPWILDKVTGWTVKYSYPLVLDEVNNLYQIAKERYGYPLEDSHQLAKVAQFLAIKEDNDMYPKEMLSLELRDRKPPNFALEEYRNTIYAVLADLNLPLYITTNYDYFMEEALRSRGRAPLSEFCRWDEKLYNYTKAAGITSVFEERRKKYKPTIEEPLVYHLHGVIDIPQSMVLTERDYLDFAINLNKNDEKISLPAVVRSALASTSLMFIGYRLEDITFRVIFQGVIRMLGEIPRPISIAVQLPPQLQQNAQSYLNVYTKNMFLVNVCWGKLDDFAKELRERLDNYMQRGGKM